MRKLILLAVVLVTGCAMPEGMRRKPGSNVVLPVKLGLVESLLRGAACAATTRDSVAQATARGGMSAGTTVSAGACSSLRQPMSGEPSPAIPPR